MSERTGLRLAVLICGILSGVIALGFGWWGAQGLLFNTSQLSQAGYIAVVLAIHVIALTSIAGGMAVLVSAPVGRIAMLSSAVGWLALIAVLGGGISLPLAGLIALSAAGGLGAFLPRVQSPAFRIERPGRAGASPLSARALAPSPAEIEIERVRAKAAAEAAADREDYLRTSRMLDSNEDHSKPFVPTEPDFVLGPIPRIDERKQSPDSRYDFRIGGPAKPKRKGSRGRASVLSGAIVVLILVLIGAPILYLVDAQLGPGGQALPALGAPSSSEPSVSRPSSEEEPRLSSQVLAPVLSLETTIASSASAEPSPSAAISSIAVESPLVAAASEPQASSPSPSPSDSATSSPASAPSSADASSVAPIVVPASLPPLASDSSFASPFDYCSAFTNSDAPEVKKIAGGLTELIFNARKQASLSQGEVHWRCMEKAVWVCVVPPGGLACDKVPDAVDRVLICASHPDAQGIRTAAGDWSCDGFTPVVSQAQLNAPDRRGFDRNVWHKVDKPDSSSG